MNEIFYTFDRILHRIADDILAALNLPPTWKVRSIAFQPDGLVRVNLTYPVGQFKETEKLWHSLEPIITTLAEHNIKIALIFP